MAQRENFQKCIAHRERAFFVFGFAKSNMDNVEGDEVEYFKKMAREVLALSDAQLELLIAKGLF